MVYIGVDLHRKVSQVAPVDEHGKLLGNRRVGTNFDELFRVFGELVPEPKQGSVAFEATFGWGWFADLLRDAGMDAHMSHPLLTKAIANARVKNDAVDAKTLAHLLRTGTLPEAWMAPPEVREARRLVRMRVSLTRMRSAPGPGPRAPGRTRSRQSDERCFRQTRPAAARGAPTASAFQGRLEACLRLIDDLGTEIEIADTEILGLYETDQRTQRLLPIPGIGPTGAAIILAEIGDIHRFPDARHLCAWAGLTVTERSSAEQTDAATSPSRAPAGCAGSWSKRPHTPSLTASWVCSSPVSRRNGGPRSPALRWPIGS